MTARCTTPREARYCPDAPRAGSGVYTLDDLRARCRVDDATGCWHWGMAITTGGNGGTRIPLLTLPAGVISAGYRTVSAPRVAWLMHTGRALSSRQVVWRTCGHDDCCAPAHVRAGTKAQEGAWRAATGQLRGDPTRRARCTRNAVVAQAVPASTVAQIEAALAGGMLQADAAARWGIHKATVSKIGRGLHAHQRLQVPQASVFTWGRTAR